MLNSFNTETLPHIHTNHNIHNISNGYGNFNQPKKNSNGQNKTTNSYATDYLNTVKENRSQYGNYVDNALAFDPHKEKKSVYNVVYETDEYNPWGKPGGGAPKLDTNTGQLATKIRGTLKWNLTGETEDDRLNRLLSNKQKSNHNLLMYKQDSPISPRQPLNEVHRQSTTYNYNYRDPYMTPSSSMENIAPAHPNHPKVTTVNALRPPADYLNQQNYSEMNSNNMNQNNSSSINNNSTTSTNQQKNNNFNLPMVYSSSNFSTAQQNIPSLPLINKSNSNNNFSMTSIEREAQDRQNFKTLNKSNSFALNRSKAAVELNRVSNKLYNDNQPTMDYPNSTYWFGRTGPAKGTHSATIDPFYQDARRHKLLDALENRSPRSFNDFTTASAQPYAFSNSPRNIYGPNIPNFSN